MAGLVLIVIIAYSFLSARKLITGPELSIISPTDGMNFSSPDVEIKGTALNASFITLNGLQIYTDQTGHFDQKLLLSRGYNIITLVAKDKFNKVVEKTLQLTYAETATATPNETGTSTSSD